MENAIIQLLYIEWKILLLWELGSWARRVRITQEREQPVPYEPFLGPRRPGPAGHGYFRELSRPFRPGECQVGSSLYNRWAVPIVMVSWPFGPFNLSTWRIGRMPSSNYGLFNGKLYGYRPFGPLIGRIIHRIRICCNLQYFLYVLNLALRFPEFWA